MRLSLTPPGPLFGDISIAETMLDRLPCCFVVGKLDSTRYRLRCTWVSCRRR
ncbi:hypothetical protein I547_5610 [Mycobacterium kansasii 824]|nr:hypothetical protein I547_5610 [Mycobacterium kansasii 824]